MAEMLGPTALLSLLCEKVSMCDHEDDLLLFQASRVSQLDFKGWIRVILFSQGPAYFG